MPDRDIQDPFLFPEISQPQVRPGTKVPRTTKSILGDIALCVVVGLYYCLMYGALLLIIHGFWFATQWNPF